MCLSSNTVTYFDSFGSKHISNAIKRFIGNKNMQANVFRIQPNDSVMCRYFVLDLSILCLRLDRFTNIFSPNNFLKHGGIILSYFKNVTRYLNDQIESMKSEAILLQRSKKEN